MKVGVIVKTYGSADFEVEIGDVDESVKQQIIHAVLTILENAMTEQKIEPVVVRGTDD